MKVSVVTSERGWPGHFIGGHRCVFHRNTLIEGGDVRAVVSTVGQYLDAQGVQQVLGPERWYETMAFMARKSGPYWDANVTQEINFDSEWGIYSCEDEKLPEDVDLKADAMHEGVVRELVERLATTGSLR